MDDYISREAAIKKFEDAEYLYDPEPGAKRYTVEDAKEILNDVPAADVRPVVLCRDCERYEKFKSGEGDADYGWCIHLGMTFTEEFFCADGERREGGTP